MIEKRRMIIPDLKSTVEIISYHFSRYKAESLYSSVYATAESLIKNNNNFVLFIWGGNTIASFALKNLSQANSRFPPYSSISVIIKIKYL
ncbi:MAG: hypothetical protein MZV64_67085 [Ignavibacteriales bacterium]|nr:hypothetical protein [Ignavibacteriales bacterium]